MKKLGRFVLSLAICVALAAGALAEPALISELGDMSWIDGTNFLRGEGRNGYYIAQIDGTAVTEDVFGLSFNYDDGLIIASKVNIEDYNRSGALNLEGEEVIPFRYGDIKVPSKDWALAFVLTAATADHYDYESWSSDDYYLIDTVDIYNLNTGACVGTLPRANYEDHYVNGNTINIKDRTSGAITAYDAEFSPLATELDSLYDDDYAQMEFSTFRSNGQEGLMDSEGNVIMEPSFQYISSFYGDYAKVSTGDTYGLIDNKGNLIVPAEYDDIDTAFYGVDGFNYDNYGYYCVEKDGKLGYVTAGGTVSCEPKYAADALENNGASATYTDIEGKLHILAGDGVETVVEGYDTVRPLYYGSGVYYAIIDEDYNYGMIDFHGNVVFPCEYHGISLSGDGHYVLVEPDYDEAEIYELTYPETGVPAASGDAAEPINNEKSKADALTKEADDAAAIDAATADAVAAADAAPEAGAAGNSDVTGLLSSAILLLNTDAATNGAAVVSLLNTALAAVGEGSAAGGVIASAITLLEADAGANGAAVVTLLQSVASLM